MPIRIPITNVFMNGDYTGQIHVGPNQKAMNVILDTGSSALAIDGTKYHPDFQNGDKSSNLAQTDAYGDGSTWTGAVVTTKLVAGASSAQVVLKDGNAAVAYQASSDMFRGADGILGLAYAPLDDAFKMPGDTWQHKYSSNAVRTGVGTTIVPYMTQLAQEGIASDIMAFYTRRSFIHSGHGGANDPLNKGWMIIGGGTESTDLYTGSFQTVKVVSDEWYNTVLKAIIVGDTSPIHARIQGPQGMPSNSIIDSGTNTLNLAPQLLTAVLSKFNAQQRELLAQAISQNTLIAPSDLAGSTWPTIKFVLQGDAGDVTLEVPSTNYLQVDVDPNNPGYALVAMSQGDAGLAILGLPLMNGYFTIFDGTADGGKGVVKFATIKV